MKKFIGALQAKGGGDTAEDVIGALRKACDLNHKGEMLQVFLICDSPSHGQQYYKESISDDHSDKIE